MNDDLISLLFETGAIKVCEKDKPFWYTSGTIGPFYINTHFTYGNEKKANDLLKMIDGAISDKTSCHDRILSAALLNYENDTGYKKLIDFMVGYIESDEDLYSCDAVSGGERRDWFFSIPAAFKLNKSHLTIFKDLDIYITKLDKTTSRKDDLSNQKVLHISDLVNEASSYVKAWIPAIRNRGGRIVNSVTVVDRNQGGAELLAENGVVLKPMIRIDSGMFERAGVNGLIDGDQLKMVKGYMSNPKESMRAFLMDHPGFLKESLSGDEKTAKRAQACMDNDFYGLPK